MLLGKELHESRDFSDGTARVIDEEAQRFVRQVEERAFKLLSEHRD